jgi:hypothetical protein
VLSGCGSGGKVAPTLLVVQDVNGPYLLTGTAKGTTGTVLFNGTFASSDPKSESGSDYFSPVTATITSTADVMLGSCKPTTFQLSGKITNPNANDLDINMTGPAPGGSMTLSGLLSKEPGGDLGSLMNLTITVTGSCALTATPVLASR